VIELDWEPRFDLLGSGRDDPHFVVEIDNEGRANLRFGDGDCGRAPEAGMQFSARYRVGNGSAGNVGREAIYHLVYRKNKPDGIDGVRNPLPAIGGTDFEPISEVKLFAPSAFRTELQRAITPADYAGIAERNPKVQRAAAVLCWTGSWYEMQVAIDPIGREELSESLRREVERDLYPFRRIGHDLRIVPARYVALDIALKICVKPDYLRGHVKAALLEVFSSRVLAGGGRGFFHPDNLSFGDGIYLSQLIAAAQAVEGVESVRVTRLQRQFERPNQELENGVLPLGPLEVARCDNDPDFPEHGRVELQVMGGR
jgi:predicted phage baseplate assembly protein